MTFDRKQYEASTAERAGRRQDRSNLAFLAQAAVKAELLTGSPHWDTFLTYVQAAIEATRVQATQIERTLADPFILDPAVIMRAKMASALARERILAWEAVMALPKDLMAEGAKARTILERMDGRQAADAA